MKVFSIDVGLHHLGMVLASLRDDGTIDEIHDCDMVDITKECCRVGCHLYHGNNIADYMYHFFGNYETSLEEADVILVEQQPPCGLVSIQELIRFQYRSKVITISPRSVHCHFDIQFLNYEKRKEASENIANFQLSNFKNYVFQERKHDMSDAYCQLKYYSFLQNQKYINKIQIEDYNKNFNTIIKKMETFSFNDVDML